jgi:hypothetical protein
MYISLTLQKIQMERMNRVLPLKHQKKRNALLLAGENFSPHHTAAEMRAGIDEAIRQPARPRLSRIRGVTFMIPPASAT